MVRADREPEHEVVVRHQLARFTEVAHHADHPALALLGLRLAERPADGIGGAIDRAREVPIDDHRLPGQPGSASWNQRPATIFSPITSANPGVTRPRHLHPPCRRSSAAAQPSLVERGHRRAGRGLHRPNDLTSRTSRVEQRRLLGRAAGAPARSMPTRTFKTFFHSKPSGRR